MNKYTLLTLLSFLAVAAILPVYALREPQRMATAQDTLRQTFVGEASVLYAENCAVCHGANGEGIGSTPALDTDVLRAADYDFLYKIIARGLYGSAMPGWHQDEGGVFNDYQIDELIALIRYGDWNDVRQLAADRGLVPASLPVPEVPDTLLAQVSTLDGAEGAAWARGLQLYAGNCTVCHGVNGEGTDLGPALNTPELQATDSAELVRLITEGVPGTLMAGWGSALASEDITAIAAFLQNWHRLTEEGVTLTPPEPIRVDVDNPEEMAALGERLFSTTCAACHGEEGSGGIGPALNSQQFLTRQDDAAIYAAIVSGGKRPFSQMPSFGERLTSVELDALVSYIRAWEPTAPMVENPRGTAQGGGPPWLRNSADGATSAQQGQGGGPPAWSGQGRGQGAGQGQGGPAQNNQSDPAAGATPGPTIAFSGRVLAVEGNLLTLEQADGTTLEAMLGPPWFWTENGIALSPADEVSGEGFQSPDHMELNWLTNHTTGETIQFRDAGGVPVWSG
jgi:mono/diheme cytochrome c family protein